ncbi:MAG TPA: HesA/MoeB/ThiF family protein [Firmicutes bacterium]|nr:HesA/MoeB/ThiF family protein [Candidatus Fermentithermobacillaceae bacterium]
MERYRRLIDLPQVGEEGLSLLSKKRALVVGAGGLGTPAAAYLVASGTGHVTIVDGDVVELSNLSRQVMYSIEDLGKAKAGVLGRKLALLNPEVVVEGLNIKIDPGDLGAVLQLVSSHDVVLSCVDNAPLRYALNQACVEREVPLVDGAVRGFTGVLTVVVPGTGPCYECAFPQSKAGKVAGGPPIWSPLPGVVGALQASEALKLMLGTGNAGAGKILLIDLLTGAFRRVSAERNPSCRVCATLRSNNIRGSR